MNASTRIQVLLAALVSLVAAGCGGSTPVAGYQNDVLLIEGHPEGVSVLLKSCSGISEGVKATANGHSFFLASRGGIGFKGCHLPGFTLSPLPSELVREPTDLQIRLTDESGTIEADVEKLSGPYKLVSRRQELVEGSADPTATAPLAARGEQLTFDLQPGVMPFSEVSAGVSTRSLENYKSWDLTPQVNGSSFTVSLPADLPAGKYDLGVYYIARPRVLKCTGIRECEARIYSIVHFAFDVE
jgi:hypothetical protein